MPRVAPISDVFNNLNNAAALRRNALSSRFFERLGTSVEDETLAMQRVRSALHEALRAMEQPNGLHPDIHERRHAAIIRRCEFERVPQKQVASDLGIGQRHFFRELAAARAAFVNRFNAVSIAREPEVSATVDIFELQLQRIRVLKYAGNFEQATRSAESLLHAVSDDDRKFEVLTLLAEVYAESGKLQPLLDLEKQATQLEPHRLPVSREALLALIRTLQARVLWMQGRPDVAAATCRPEMFVDSLKLTAPRERLLWSSALLDSATFQSFMGHYETSASQILTAHSLLRNADRVPPMLRFRQLITLAHLNLTALEFDCAKANLTRAYEFAVQNNLVAAAFDASLTLATAQMLNGEFSTAAGNARNAIQALSDMPIVNKQWHFMVAAEIETGCNNSDRALALLAQIRGQDEEDVMRTWLARAMEAECYANLHRYKDALQMALSASSGFRKGGVERALGYSLRIAAEAQTRIGATAETREYIAESVELLERCGHRISLAKALELSGKFTGNRSHARRARDLRAEG